MEKSLNENSINSIEKQVIQQLLFFIDLNFRKIFVEKWFHLDFQNNFCRNYLTKSKQRRSFPIHNKKNSINWIGSC